MSLFGSISTSQPNAFGTIPSAQPPTLSPGEVPDLEVLNPPSDSVSAISWSPIADYLAVSSWDNQVRVYEVQNLSTIGKASYSHEAPVLSVCWNKEGNKILSGGADKAGRMYDVVTGQTTQIAQHDAPISHIKWIDANGGICVTGSWDQSIKYWDLRQSQPIGSLSLGERVYALDVQGGLLVAGVGEREIRVIRLDQPGQIYKMQTRCVAIFPDQRGFAIGSIEGRVAIQDMMDEKNNFSFKCHRIEALPTNSVPKGNTNIYAVNAISFHEQQGTFSTAGSDGTIYFWDKDSRTRLKSFSARGGPIVSTGFNYNGILFAYAVSYDWSYGHAKNDGTYPTRVMVHTCREDEVKKRPKK